MLDVEVVEFVFVLELECMVMFGFLFFEKLARAGIVEVFDGQNSETA